VPFSPIFSRSERYFLATTTTSRLYALQTETFNITWSLSGNIPFSAKPVVSHDDLYVYTTRKNGMITAFDMKNGEEVWTLTCLDIQNTANSTESISRAASRCVDLIEAEASISPNGLIYFYGDKFGNVNALQLGDSTIPTASPSDFPTFPPPSRSPSVSADAPFVDPSQYPNGKKPFIPTLAPIDWAEVLYKSSAEQLSQPCFKASIIFVTLLVLFFFEF
jgi:PQQ-like domain